MYYFYKQGKQDAQIAKEPTNSSSGNSNISYKTDWNKVLKKGSKGKEVEILQTALKTLKADGNFGDLTESRLKKVLNITETSLNNYNKLINKK
jgi:hypothetical protein